MSGLTASQRGDLAEDMLPVAARLATLVHGDGGQEDIGQILGVLDDAEKTALIVVLAGLADPDRPLGALLGWLDFDETGEPTEPEYGSRTTLRQIVETLDDADIDSRLPDEVAVARYLAGQQTKLRTEDRIAAIQTGMRRGMTWGDFDQLSGVAKGSTQRFFLRHQKAAALRGEVLESGTTNDCERVTLTDADAREIRELAEQGLGTDRIARRWHISKTTVRAIRRGEKFPDAGGPIREISAQVAGPRVPGPLSMPMKKTVRESAAS